MEDELRAAVRGTAPTLVVDLHGALTTLGSEVLETALEDARRLAAHTVLLNFHDVDYINSAGVAVLIRLMGRMRETDQKLAFVELQPHYRKVFHMMGLFQFAPVFDSEREAIETLQLS